MLGLARSSTTSHSPFLRRGRLLLAGNNGSSCGNLLGVEGRVFQGRAAAATATTHNYNCYYYSREQRHSYMSRAHPQQLPEYPISTALQMVLEETQERSVKRATKWERNAPVRTKKGIQVCRNNQ
jgi:hypothetical protein